MYRIYTPIFLDQAVKTKWSVENSGKMGSKTRLFRKQKYLGTKIN